MYRIFSDISVSFSHFGDFLTHQFLFYDEKKLNNLFSNSQRKRKKTRPSTLQRDNNDAKMMVRIQYDVVKTLNYNRY